MCKDYQELTQPLALIDSVGVYFKDGHPQHQIDSMTEVGMTRGLKMYSWSAQAMYGDNKTPKPWSFNLVASMKWNAWKKIEGMDRV